MKPPRISWFIPNPPLMGFRKLLGYQSWDPDLSIPSVWIRSFQVAPYLNDYGFITSYNTLDPRPDVAIFLRSYNPADLEKASTLKKLGTKIVLDVVANYFNVREKSETGVGESLPSLVKSFLQLVEIADQVWAVSPYLAEKANRLNPNSFFVSDSVDPKYFDADLYRCTSKKTCLTLGWSGARKKASELNEISRVLSDWIKRERVRVLVIARNRPELDFPITFYRWNYSSFPEMISQCDLCIAPRAVRNEYDLGHSLFKIGVFMAMGVPALAGPVPSYNLLLGDGVGGSICNTLDEWTFHLQELILNDTSRISAGKQSKEKMRPYLTPVIASQISGLLKDLLNQ